MREIVVAAIVPRLVADSQEDQDARSDGEFTFRGTLTDDYADVADYVGTHGLFDLQALLDPNSTTGNNASGTVQITGAIEALGIFNPDEILMTADIIGYEVIARDLLGLAIDNIYCHGAINFCATAAAQIESVYFKIDTTFQASADGFSFRAGVNTTTTVPVPAAAWLMLSGLGWMGFMGARRKT